jgi:hypothetical protein
MRKEKTILKNDASFILKSCLFIIFYLEVEAK